MSTLAVQACATCRKQKRKCDKTLPICGLCGRHGKTCEYDGEAKGAKDGSPTAAEFEGLKRKVRALEGLLVEGGNGERKGANGTFESAAEVVLARRGDITATTSNGSSTIDKGVSHNNSSFEDGTTSPSTAEVSPTNENQPSATTTPPTFPPLFFLDAEIFQYDGFDQYRPAIPRPTIRVPPIYLASLGSSTELRSSIETYFATVHTYFPVISKIRLYQHLANPSHEPGADVALLFLAMRLISSPVAAGIAPAMWQQYQDVKALYSIVEAQAGFSVHLIQAVLLTALFEIGHAIYPSAYLTTGHCARLGHAMGLHAQHAPQMLKMAVTWTEQEERRRVWWGVIVLDRVVNAGHRGKPLATADPGLESHLPTDDASWDRGQMLVAAPLRLSASETVRTSAFARTCQAGHVLGRVIHNLDDRNLPVEYRFDEALQLNRTVRALVEAIQNESEDDAEEGPTLCTALAICYSALLILFDGYSCTQRAVENGPEAQLVMQQTSITGIFEISDRVSHLARRLRNHVQTAGMNKVSPLMFDALYGTAANYAWHTRETSDPTSGERVAELRGFLQCLNARWRVAGEVLQSPYFVD